MFRFLCACGARCLDVKSNWSAKARRRFPWEYPSPQPIQLQLALWIKILTSPLTGSRFVLLWGAWQLADQDFLVACLRTLVLPTSPHSLRCAWIWDTPVVFPTCSPLRDPSSLFPAGGSRLPNSHRRIPRPTGCGMRWWESVIIRLLPICMQSHSQICARCPREKLVGLGPYRALKGLKGPSVPVGPEMIYKRDSTFFSSRVWGWEGPHGPPGRGSFFL